MMLEWELELERSIHYYRYVLVLKAKALLTTPPLKKINHQGQAERNHVCGYIESVVVVVVVSI